MTLLIAIVLLMQMDAPWWAYAGALVAWLCCVGWQLMMFDIVRTRR